MTSHHPPIYTDRLFLTSLSREHADFILALTNTEGWLRFIGNRNINSVTDALDYINRLLDNPNAEYRVVCHRDTLVPLGVVTLVQRDYLTHRDLGFAFLPEYNGQGFAFEAASQVLTEFRETTLHAITVKDNSRSIRLLEKLGFSFERTILPDNEELSLFTKATV